MTGRWPIPASWQWARAATLAEVVGGGTPRTTDPDHFTGSPDGAIAWLTPADLSGHAAMLVHHGARYLTPRGHRASAARLLLSRLDEVPAAGPIRLLELGAGSGLFARHLLDELQRLCAEQGRSDEDQALRLGVERGAGPAAVLGLLLWDGGAGGGLDPEEHGLADLTLTTPTRACLLYTSPSPRDRTRSRMPSSA